MAFKHMSIAGVVSVSRPLSDPAHPETQALMAIPEAAGLVVHVARAREALLGIAPETTRSERDKAISEELANLDGQHDNQVRGLHAVLSGLSWLAADEAAAAIWSDLRDRLLPQGLSVVSRSYRDEAGEAELLGARLDPETRARLATVALPDGNLLGAAERIVAIGERIGALEDERTPSEEGPSLRGAILDARNRWVRAMNALLGVLALSEPDPDGIAARFRDRVELAAALATPKPTPATVAAPATPPAPTIAPETAEA